MQLVSTLILETPRKTLTVPLRIPITIHEIRQQCHVLGVGATPQAITMTGDVARVTYEGFKHQKAA